MSQPLPSTASQLIPRQPRKRANKLWLFALPIVLMATAAGSYLALKPNGSKNFTGINLLPANTLMATALVVDRSDWSRVRQLGTPASRAWLEQKITGKDWFGELVVADLAAWVGQDIYLAQLPRGKNLALLSIRNTAPASKGKSRQYQGVTIYETNTSAQAVVVTKSEKFLAVSATAQAIEQVIDTTKSGQSLAKSEGYALAINALPTEDKIGQVYLNLPGILGNKKEITSQGLLMNLVAKDQVLTAKGVVWGSHKLLASQHSPEIAQLVPTKTMLLLSGSSLTRLWQDYSTLAVANGPIAPQTIQKNLEASTSLDLTKDILPWGGGEFGLALVASTSEDTPLTTTNSSSMTGGALLLLSKSTDRAATDRAMTKLDKNMTEKQYRVEQNTFQGANIIRWSAPIGGVQATRGWLSNNVAFLTIGAPVAEQFLPKPNSSLRDSSTFQQVMQSQIAPFDGQFYLDLSQMITSGNIVPTQFPADTQTIMMAIQSIGLTTNGITTPAKSVANYQQRFDLSISLKNQPDLAK
jgi:Protein of unknown function (DUF3352)